MKRFLSFFLVLTVLITTGAGCGGPSAAETAASKPVTIKIWRVFDSQSTMAAIMSAYQAIHPNVSFDYRELRVDEYKNELLRAFAEGTGPDVFSVHNTWIGEYQSLMAPLPSTLSIPYTVTQGTIKKEQVTTIHTDPTISVRQLKNDFIDIVTDDVVRPWSPGPNLPAQPAIWGLPLGVDVMALFYNKDLLNAAGIAEPPKTWNEFQTDVAANKTKLTLVGSGDVIIQSGGAIGTAHNVERAVDILSLLMMQDGVPIVNDNGTATFATPNENRDVLGAEALRFYTDFANPFREVYTWNNKQPGSFEAFVTGKTAFFFGYTYHIPLIKAANPKLKYAVTPMPQIENGRTVNFANYWVETVAKASPNQNWAWDFIQFAAKADQVKTYLAASGKPTALRALITPELDDEALSPFASELLTAKSWYKGKNAAVAEGAFLDLIDASLAGAEITKALNDAQNKVNQTL